MMYPSQPPLEQPIYNDGQVTVTTARFIAGSMMYPIRGITAVQPILIPANRGGGILAASVGIVLAGLGFAAEHGGISVVGFLILVVGIAVAVIAKPKYIVRVWTAGGQVDAVWSEDQARMQQIVNALHRATMGG